LSVKDDMGKVSSAVRGSYKGRKGRNLVGKSSLPNWPSRRAHAQTGGGDTPSEKTMQGNRNLLFLWARGET